MICGGQGTIEMLWQDRKAGTCSWRVARRGRPFQEAASGTCKLEGGRSLAEATSLTAAEGLEKGSQAGFSRSVSAWTDRMISVR